MGASLISCAGSTMSQFPLKGSSNHPSKGGKAALGSLASHSSLSDFLEGKLSLTACGQRLEADPWMGHWRSGAIACFASSQPTQEHRGLYLPGWKLFLK